MPLSVCIYLFKNNSFNYILSLEGVERRKVNLRLKLENGQENKDRTPRKALRSVLYEVVWYVMPVETEHLIRAVENLKKERISGSSSKLSYSQSG